MLNSHSNRALKNRTKLCLEDFCLSCPGLVFCGEDFSWFLLFAPLLLLSGTASPQSLHSQHIFFLSAVLFMQTDFIIRWVCWCFLGAGKPSGELQLCHRLRAVIQSGFVSLKYVVTAFENPWCATPRGEGSGSASLSIICEEIKSYLRLFFGFWAASRAPLLSQ